MEVRPIDANALKEFYGTWSNNRTEFLKPEVDRYVDVQPTLDYAPIQKIDGNTSDGYHTFNELYHHRAILFAVIVSQFKSIAWKSKLHSDGTMYDGMFIVGINTLQGQATYHYDIDPYWGMFDCKEVERAPEWDGHTAEQAIERIATLRLLEPLKEPVRHGEWIGCMCSVCGGNYMDYTDADSCPAIGEPKPNYCPNCGAKMDGGKKDA